MLGPTDIEELDTDTTSSLFGRARETDWYSHLTRHVRERADDLPTERLQGFERPDGRRIVVVSEDVGGRSLPGASMTFTFKEGRIVDARAETHPSETVVEYVVPNKFAPGEDEMDSDIHGIPGAEMTSVQHNEQLTVFELSLPERSR